MKNFFKRKLVWFVIIVAVIVFFIIRNQESEPLEFVEVERGDIVQTVDINGIYEPEVYANLSFEIGGEIREVYKKEGDRVKKGEKILKLSPVDLSNDLRIAQNNARRVEEEEKLARRSTWDDLKPEQKDIYRIASQNARDQVSKVQSQFRKLYVESPIDGVLVGVKPQIGEVVSPGVPVARVIQGNNFYITADVSESDVTKLQIGQKAIVTFDALGSDREFESKLMRIAQDATVIQGVIYYETTFMLADTPPELLSGMSADLEVEIEKRANVLFLPKYIIEKDDAGEYVEVILSEEVQEREKVYVQTGLDDSLGNIEVISGLNEGDKVLVK